MPYSSSHVLWRAAITLELLYGLISEQFDDLSPLLALRNGNNNLLSVLIDAVTDFSVVVSSNEVGIMNIVRVSDLKQDNRVMSEGANDAPGVSEMPMRSFKFDVEPIESLITSRARDIVKVRNFKPNDAV